MFGALAGRYRFLGNVGFRLVRVTGRYAERLQIGLSMLSAVSQGYDVITIPFPGSQDAPALGAPAIMLPEHADLDAGWDGLIVVRSDPFLDGSHAACPVKASGLTPIMFDTTSRIASLLAWNSCLFIERRDWLLALRRMT